MRKTAIAILLAAGTIAAAPAWPQATMDAFETGVEADTSYVTLPSQPSGPWLVAPCAGCTSHQLRLDAETRYFVGKTAVSFETLRKLAAHGPQNLDLYYVTKTRRVTRVVLRADLPSEGQKPAAQPRRKDG